MFDKYNNIATLVRDNAVMGFLIYLCIIQTANFVIGLLRDMRVNKAIKTALEMSNIVKETFGNLAAPKVNLDQKSMFGR